MWLLIYAAHALVAWLDWRDGDHLWMSSVIWMFGLLFLLVTTGCPLFAMVLLVSGFDCIGRICR